MNRKNRVVRFLPYLIILTLSLQYLLLSIETNEIFTQIVGEELALFDFIKSINNITFALIPVVVFAYIYITTKIMLSVFDVSVDNKKLADVILYGMIIPLSGVCFYTINFIFFRNGDLASIEDIQKFTFSFNLRIADFKLINEICWIMLYVVLLLFLSIKVKVNIVKSFIICVLPSICILIFNLLFK